MCKRSDFPCSFCTSKCSDVWGIRYECQSCDNFILCALCGSLPFDHEVDHTFIKIRSNKKDITFPSRGMTNLKSGFILKSGHETIPEQHEEGSETEVNTSFLSMMRKLEGFFPKRQQKAGQQQREDHGRRSTMKSDCCRNNCVICLEKESIIMCNPCHHVVYCEDCRDNAVSRRMGCPICRSPVSAYVRIFL